MPRVIPTSTNEVYGVGDLVEALEAGGFDPRDEESYVAFAPALSKLANNRDFLSDLMIDELKQRCAGQIRDNQYSAQVIMLHVAQRRYAIRANFWPAMTDSIVRHSGTDPFFYDVPHDHNFSFLTVGYVGPGYWSDYYDYDYGEVVGYPGEAVNLRFVERARLSEGKVMLYRAHRDIHRQLPADAMSVSLNILESSHSSAFRDQYRFDLDRGTIDGILTRVSLEPMLSFAAHYGGEDGLDLIADFARHHPSERIRWAALRARAAAAPDLDGRLQVLEDGARGAGPLVDAMARREIARVEAGRSWLESGPKAA